MIREADKSIDRLLLDDPVRPSIPVDIRISKNNKVFYYYDSETDTAPKAIVCTAVRDFIPISEDDIVAESSDKTNSVLILYTIWSYTAGAGRSLVFELLDYVKNSLSEIERIVTLSPKTEMARKFHTRNGAVELQENELTINYEYPINKNTHSF